MNVNVVIEFLKTEGKYASTSEPIHILDIDFHFEGVLLGPENQNNLILVHGLTTNSLKSVLKKVRAFTLALERTASMRVVTLVIVGPPEDSSMLAELGQLCRVLVVPDDASLRESLESILPLSLPSPVSASDTAEAALKVELGESINEPFVVKLIKSARDGEEHLRKTLCSVVEEIAEPPKTL